MHIVLGLLGALVTILILVNRLAENGIDVGWLNPFAWHRRRQWRKKYEGDPIFKVERPVDVAGLLMLGVARRDGELASSEKAKLLEFFREELKLSERDAAALLTASAHLLGTGEALYGRLGKVLAPSRSAFTEAQARSTVELMERVAAADGAPSTLQRDFIAKVREKLLPEPAKAGTWE